MPRKALGSLIHSQDDRLLNVEKNVRRPLPPRNPVISQIFDIDSKRLHGVKIEEFEDTIYFKSKREKGSIIGYARLNTPKSDELNIDFFEVYKPLRKNGYGREIYRWLEDYARRRGIKMITVISLDEATGFWRKMGLKRGVWSKPGYLSMFKVLESGDE